MTIANQIGGFRRVELAGGRMQIAPGGIRLLNPEREGDARHLYLVWAYKDGEQAGLDAAVGGGALGPFMGFFTDYEELYAMGRHDVVPLRDHFEEMRGDFVELMRLVIDAVDPVVAKGEEWSYAFCICDCMGIEVPVGTGYSFVKRGR